MKQPGNRGNLRGGSCFLRTTIQPNLCLCPDCKSIADREGSESGPLIEFVNHAARGLKEEFPDVQVLTEAYNFTIQPPATIRPETNVVVRIL